MDDTTLSTYRQFESTSDETRRLLRQEELIIEVTEALAVALRESGMTKTQLAETLGKSKGYISQLFGGGRNLTLRSIASVADALGVRPRVRMVREMPQSIENTVSSSVIPKKRTVEKMSTIGGISFVDEMADVRRIRPRRTQEKPQQLYELGRAA